MLFATNCLNLRIPLTVTQSTNYKFGQRIRYRNNNRLLHSTLREETVIDSFPSNGTSFPSIIEDMNIIDAEYENMINMDEIEKELTKEAMSIETTQPNDETNPVFDFVLDKIGQVDADRLTFEELGSGEVTRLFSNIQYEKSSNRTKAVHATGSTIGATALVFGTTVGAGVLGLPSAIAPSGFIPSVAGLGVAWIYMVFSGLLIAELSINRIGETGRPGIGVLNLYQSELDSNTSLLGSAAYYFLHYAMMVAYIAQGGNNLSTVLSGVGIDQIGSGQVLFAATLGLGIYCSKPQIIEKANNLLVGVLGLIFLSLIGIGAQSADFSALLEGTNQHPEHLVEAAPILFLSLVYQNVVPTIVTQLEGDKTKITKAIVFGTLAPFLLFVGWNAVILGNAFNAPAEVLEQISSGLLDPVVFLQTNNEQSSQLLPLLLQSFSSLALTTSLVGFVYGLLDALTDSFNLPTNGPLFEKVKPALFMGIFLPPLLLSLLNPNIFYTALEYGGAYGVSTLFLILPPYIIYQKRYADTKKNITTLPMVPGGKFSLGVLWKAAFGLIVEQTADKLGILDWIM